MIVTTLRRASQACLHLQPACLLQCQLRLHAPQLDLLEHQTHTHTHTTETLLVAVLQQKNIYTNNLYILLFNLSKEFYQWCQMLTSVSNQV